MVTLVLFGLTLMTFNMTSSWCKYHALGGLPGIGVHSYRVFDIAIIDVIVSFAVAYMVAKRYNYSLTRVSLMLFMISIMLHRLFCVRTTIDKLLFES